MNISKCAIKNGFHKSSHITHGSNAWMINLFIANYFKSVAILSSYKGIGQFYKTNSHMVLNS